MSFLAKLQSVNAPKTEDAEYEEARTFFKTCEDLDLKAYGQTVRSLGHSITDLSASFLKFTTAAKAWVDQGAPSDLQAKAILSTHTATRMNDFAKSLIESRIEPVFINPLITYGASRSALAKVKHARMAAVSEYDKAREYLRRLETAKKPKKADLDKARAKTEETKTKYLALNAQFLAETATFREAIPGALGTPFQSMVALFCQYIRKIHPGLDVDVKAEARQEKPEVVLSRRQSTAGIPIWVASADEVGLEEEALLVWNRPRQRRTSEYGMARRSSLDRDGWADVFRPVSLHFGDIDVTTAYPDNPFAA
jgi:hypothetical protein